MVYILLSQNRKAITEKTVVSGLLNLKYYFHLKVCMSVYHSLDLAPIPEGELLNITNKSCYIYLRGDKNALGVIQLPPGLGPRGTQGGPGGSTPNFIKSKKSDSGRLISIVVPGIYVYSIVTVPRSTWALGCSRSGYFLVTSGPV